MISFVVQTGDIIADSLSHFCHIVLCYFAAKTDKGDRGHKTIVSLVGYVCNWTGGSRCAVFGISDESILFSQIVIYKGTNHDLEDKQSKKIPHNDFVVRDDFHFPQDREYYL